MQTTSQVEPGKVFSECSHILPFSIHTKVGFHSVIVHHILRWVTQPPVQTALEMFAPNWLNATDIAQYINHPSNAAIFELNVHKAFDDLLWGIEAIPGDPAVHPSPCCWLSPHYLLILQNGVQPRYIYRTIKEGWFHPFIQLRDGDALVFGGGSIASPEILPNPQYCNIKLAIGRVLRACGAAEVIDFLYYKNEESHDEGAISYLGSSLVTLDLLDIHLHQIAVV